MEIEGEEEEVGMEEEEEEEDGVTAAKLQAWEKNYERSWEAVEEDETGALKTVLIEQQNRQRRTRARAQRDARTVRRGMSRHLFLVVDCSKAMEDKSDMKPSRMAVALRTAELFIKEFFDQNPIAQMGIIVMRNAIAEKITELSGNPNRHIAELKAEMSSQGDASLQNALMVARASLCHIPKYGSREVLVIFGGLSTCDPGDINDTIATLKRDRIRCSVVSLAAEVFVCRKTAEATGGTYHVALHQEHFKELMLLHTPPPPTASSNDLEASLIRMGFPMRRADENPSLCICHQTLKVGGFFCPQCKAKYCELPIDCQICNLSLVSSPHLARSYHHLFPIPNFTPIPENSPEKQCYGCLRWVSRGTGTLYKCPRCKKAFCYDCDLFIHESLHNCPGCEHAQH
ncbi:General transcription factor IIH subunit [Balamuthia mandrillaris]